MEKLVVFCSSKKSQYLILLVVGLIVFLAPLQTSFAQISQGIIPCGTTSTHPECTFDDLVTLVTNVINYLILVSAPIAAIMFTYAGMLYLTAAGDTGKISKAHGIFWTVFIGFLIVLAAWLIVKSISVLVTPDYRATT